MSFRWSTAVVHLSTVYTWYSRIKHEHLERGVGTNCSFADTNKRKWKVASLLPLFLLHSFCNSLSLHSKSISLPGTKRTIKCVGGFFCLFQTMYGITVVVIVLLSANVLRSTWTYGNKNMFWGGLATFLLAFTLWNIGEKKMCLYSLSNKAYYIYRQSFLSWSCIIS